MTKTILFVCTGNSCRSVMAKLIFQRMLEEKGHSDIKLTSAGTDAPEGMSPPQVMQELMAREGMDVSEHRAKRLTKDLVKEADLILVMEKYHRQAILNICPDASDKIFLLKEFSPNRDERYIDIPDPIGKPMEAYEKIFKEIEGCLQEFLKRMDWYLSRGIQGGSGG